MTTACGSAGLEPGSPEAGFSLIDMLVALALLAVMSGLMASFLGQFRTIGRLQQDAEAQSELEAVMSYLEQTIGAAMPLPLIHLPPERRASLEGTAPSLQFVAVARQGVQSFGLRETEIGLKGDGDAKTLVQIFRPRRLDETAQTAAAVSVELARGVGGITFRYLSHDPATGEPVWSDAWKDRSGLPAAVRITLTVTREGKVLSVQGEALLKLAEGSVADPASAGGL